MANIERSRLDRADGSIQRVWRLTPTGQHSLFWLNSIYKGPVVVRAPNAATARSVVARAFGLVRPTRPAEIANVPWLQEPLATCDEVDDQPGRSVGPTRILEPLDLRGGLIRPPSQPRTTAVPQPDKPDDA